MAALTMAEPRGLALAAFLARAVPSSTTAASAALAAVAACSGVTTLAAPGTQYPFGSRSFAAGGKVLRVRCARRTFVVTHSLTVRCAAARAAGVPAAVEGRARRVLTAQPADQRGALVRLRESRRLPPHLPPR
jgi:hypothetical protein